MGHEHNRGQSGQLKPPRAPPDRPDRKEEPCGLSVPGSQPRVGLDLKGVSAGGPTGEMRFAQLGLAPALIEPRDAVAESYGVLIDERHRREANVKRALRPGHGDALS